MSSAAGKGKPQGEVPGREPPHLILASQSPRRAELLGRLGLTFEVVPAEIDESWHPGEAPIAHAERLAREKAGVIATRQPHALVIASDTIVVVDGEVLGKPRNRAHAIDMLGRLSGREHEVLSGVAVAWGERIESGVESVRVRFRPISPVERAEYAATGEPLDKAGAYGIQGRGSALVSGIDGDYYAVVGLPITRLISLFGRFGL